MKKYFLFLLFFSILFPAISLAVDDPYKKIENCILEKNQWYSKETNKFIDELNSKIEKGEINTNEYQEISKQKNNELLTEYNNSLAGCYKETDFQNIWDLPVLKQSLIDQYKDVSILSQDQLNQIYLCIKDVNEHFDLSKPSAASQRAIKVCFSAVGLENTANVYEKEAIVIDCAKDSLGVKEFGQLFGEITPKQEKYLEKCVIKKTAPIVTGIAVLNVPFVAGISNTVLYLQFLFTQPLILFRRRKKNCGIVSNAFSGEPIDLGVVRLIDEEKNKLIKTVVTSKKGYYLFLPLPGKYKMEFKKSGFSFPSIFKKLADNSHYFGEIIIVENQSDVINKNILVDPEKKEITVGKFLWKKWRNRLAFSLAFISPIFSIFSLLLVPRLWVVLIAVINIILLLVFFRLGVKKRGKYFGTIKDSAGRSLGGAMVTLYNKEYGKLISNYVTDIFGRYYLPVFSGDYILLINKSGFKQQKIEVTVNEKQTENDKVNVDVVLDTI